MLPAPPTLSSAAFRQLQGTFRAVSGISLSSVKQTLVASRLRSRLVHLGLPDFDAYCRYLEKRDNEGERRVLVDLLTTNETYFFREPEHFRILSESVRGDLRDVPLRIWSAASSTGEEAFSIAMTMADARGMNGWEITASDLSSRALERARKAMYEMQRLELMPAGYLKKYCLRGTGQYEGRFRINRPLRERVTFCAHNLQDDARALGEFDIVFLRNALIYFDDERKKHILSRVISRIRPGGWLYVGHSESLHGIELPLRRHAKAVYQRR